MKKGAYGRGIKAAALLLEVLLVVFCAVCIGMVSCNALISVPNRSNTMNVNYYISPFSKTADFEDSDVFNDMVYDNLNEVLRYCVIREQLETDGKIDETKEIDIQQYARHFEETPVSASGITYRLGDLIQWGQYQDGLSYQVYSYEEAERMIREAHRKAKQQSAEGKSAEQLRETGEDVITEEAIAQEAVAQEANSLAIEEATSEYVQEKRVQVPVERYLPSDGASLLEHVWSVEELEKMSNYLDETIQMLGDNYISYKDYQKYYQGEQKSLRYCMIQEKDEETLLYTNMEEEGKSRQQIGEEFSELGRYLYFSPAEFAYETNTSLREEQVRMLWNRYRYAYPDRTAIWLGVHTAFAWDDAFRSARDSYQMAAPGYLFILLSICSGVLALALLSVLTGMAGKRKGQEEIALLWFDRWYTELSALLGVCVVGFMMVVLAEFGVSGLYYREIENRVQLLSGLALLTAFGCAAFLFFYLSLVRRIKAGIFWNNFLIYRIVKRFHTILMALYDDSRNVVRVWIPYLLFVGGNIALLTRGYEDGLALAVLLDLIVGIFLYRNNQVRRKILEGIENIRGGNLDYQIEVKRMHGDDRILAEAVNSIGNGIRQAVETSMKDERMKADLITNVSHDIKTPLTSIINYVDLIKREPVENEKIQGYLEILESKSQRLKQLTEDLVEASKISSGNIELSCDHLDLVELMNQTVGEFTEKFAERGLRLIVSMEEKPLLIYADSRRIWRVVENLFNNVYKYALENTRVYVETKRIIEKGTLGSVRLSIKNISEKPLSVAAEELTERFIRGDASRTTEGSGLGLSIAKNLTELQKGKFEIFSDGDLFKVIITFAISK